MFVQDTGVDELSYSVQDFYQNLSEGRIVPLKGAPTILNSRSHLKLPMIFTKKGNIAHFRAHFHCINLFWGFVGPSDHIERIMDEVEKYMMTRLYQEVFCPETTDDEKKDLAIQKRIRFAHRTSDFYCWCPKRGREVTFPLLCVVTETCTGSP